MSTVHRLRLSVIIPTYRREWELKRALESLTCQAFSDFEVIVVDDNCDEIWNRNTENLILEVQKANPDVPLRWVRNDSRKGSAESRNAGVKAAAGEYITFLDDDDEYLQGKLSRQYAFMQENKLDYSITDLDLYFENGHLAERRNRSYIEKTDRISLLEYHFMYHMTGTDTIMIRKDYFEAIGGFPPIDLGDEFYLMQRAIEHDGGFGYLKGCDVRAYVHTGNGGLSSGEGKIIGEKRLYAHKKNYLHLLSAKSVRYIRMRHYAVLGYAGLRSYRIGYFLYCGIRSFFSAPIQCVQMLLDQWKSRAEVHHAEEKMQTTA